MNKTVLIIEDDDDIRDLLETALSIKGYQVFCAHDGSLGIELLEANTFTPGVVLLDLMMPGIFQDRCRVNLCTHLLT